MNNRRQFRIPNSIKNLRFSFPKIQLYKFLVMSVKLQIKGFCVLNVYFNSKLRDILPKVYIVSNFVRMHCEKIWLELAELSSLVSA